MATARCIQAHAGTPSFNFGSNDNAHIVISCVNYFESLWMRKVPWRKTVLYSKTGSPHQSSVYSAAPSKHPVDKPTSMRFVIPCDCNHP